MNENDLYDESTLLNQPWNPVSYFEEENEATGISLCYCLCIPSP